MTRSAFSFALERLGIFLRYTVALPTFSLLHLLLLLNPFSFYQLSQFLLWGFRPILGYLEVLCWLVMGKMLL